VEPSKRVCEVRILEKTFFNGRAAEAFMSVRGGVPMSSDEEEIFTIKELSEHLRVHPTTIYRLLRQGRLPGFRVGSNWRFNRAAIEQWEKLQASEPQAPTGRGRHKSEKKGSL